MNGPAAAGPGLLHESLLTARLEPGAARGFAPLFIAALAQRQSPAFDPADPAAAPEDLRLTLLETELLHVMFDRAFRFDADPSAGVAAPSRLRTLAVAPGLCDELKAFYGKVGVKLVDKGINDVKDQLTQSALRGVGVIEAEAAQFGS